MKNGMLEIKDLKGAKPHFTKSGNIKLGENMWVWSTMKGSFDEKRYVNDFGGNCSGTCGKLCECCTKSCYVNRSYRYGSVIKGHTVNTVWMKEDMAGTFKELKAQLTRAKKKPSIIRINQSGEIMTNAELIEWGKLAKAFPEITMYLYTKNYTAIGNLNAKYATDALKKLPVNIFAAGTEQIVKEWPKNLTILVSIWHDVGTKAYDMYKDIPNIKCFVYDDGEDLKIKPQTYCKAYDENGKLNHDITCEKCRKCFNRSINCKIIGCKAH